MKTIPRPEAKPGGGVQVNTLSMVRGVFGPSFFIDFRLSLENHPTRSPGFWTVEMGEFLSVLLQAREGGVSYA